ncbi:hypothetical protein D1872_242570 [compost metagenome]
MLLTAFGKETSAPNSTNATKYLFCSVRRIWTGVTIGVFVVLRIVGSRSADPIASIKVTLNRREIPFCPTLSMIGPAVRATKVHPREPHNR